MKGVFFTVKACAREMVAQNRGGCVEKRAFVLYYLVMEQAFNAGCFRM
jgi:hypothetical protein